MKKLLAVLLSSALVMSMVACGGNNNASTEPNNSEVATEVATEATTEATEESTEAATEVSGETRGQAYLKAFQELVASNPDMTAQEIAEALLANEEITLFDGVAMAVEPGFLMGFNSEITGFEEASQFSPWIGSIPFMGFIFTLAEDADVDAFVAQLETNANPAWNICTEADETVIEANGNTVFFLMCPNE